MDNQNLDAMSVIRQASKRKRVEAGQAYMMALQSSLVVGEGIDELQHDHRRFYLCGIDLIAESEDP